MLSDVQRQNSAANQPVPIFSANSFHKHTDEATMPEDASVLYQLIHVLIFVLQRAALQVKEVNTEFCIAITQLILPHSV